jgi:hypothetical protein
MLLERRGSQYQVLKVQEEGRTDQYAGAPRRLTATDRFEGPITRNVGAIIVFGANTHGIAATAWLLYCTSLSRLG